MNEENAFSNLKINALFPTMLLEASIPNAARLNDELKQIINDHKANDPGIKRSNLSGWHSNEQMTQWGGETAKQLAVEVLKLCMSQTHDDDMFQENAEPDIVWKCDMWANVSGAGASNQVHAHPCSFWSAVYYVDDGYSAGYTQDEGGELLLLDPRFPGAYMYANDLHFINGNDNTVLKSSHKIIPSAGNLVVFPSWLMHLVKPFYGSRDRISIAINLYVSRQRDRQITTKESVEIDLENN